LAEASKRRGSEAFFGRRKNKALSARKDKLLRETLPPLKIDLGREATQALDDLFSNKRKHIILEIGFGGGEHLIHQAICEPECGFIGVEPFINSMVKALDTIERRDIANVRLYDDDAAELLDWLPEKSLQRIDLLYPDPWPKKKHWKRRFVNERNMDRFARVLKSGGLFRFASDVDTYVNWTLLHGLKHEEFHWIARNAQDWRNPFENWIQTRYEAKAVREGRASAYLTFERR